MEQSVQASPFLVYWHLIMLYGSIAMFATGILTYVGHKLKIASIKGYREKYDYINRREIKNYELIFIFFAIGTMMIINRYGMDKLGEVEVWFFVRLFMSVAGGI